MPSGRVSALWRYPVKSLLGMSVPEAPLTAAGLLGDRAYAIIDLETGKVASAKRPQLWRRMLELSAVADADGELSVRFPEGDAVALGDPTLDARLSAFLGRAVTLAAQPRDEEALDRAVPHQVLDAGEQAEVESTHLTLAQASPEGGFFDYAPFHVVTLNSLEAIAAASGNDTIVPQRYRANIVLDMPDAEPFAENGWTGLELSIGPDVTLTVIGATPRCAVPMLAHGDLPRADAALTKVAELNRIELPEFGPGLYPCLGAFATLKRGGGAAVDHAVALGGTG